MKHYHNDLLADVLYAAAAIVFFLAIIDVWDWELAWGFLLTSLGLIVDQ